MFYIPTMRRNIHVARDTLIARKIGGRFYETYMLRNNWVDCSTMRMRILEWVLSGRRLFANN